MPTNANSAPSGTGATDNFKPGDKGAINDPAVPGKFTKAHYQTGKSTDDYPTFGIDGVSTRYPGTTHYNKIEVYGDEALRDRIIALLNAPEPPETKLREAFNAGVAWQKEMAAPAPAATDREGLSWQEQFQEIMEAREDAEDASMRALLRALHNNGHVIAKAKP